MVAKVIIGFFAGLAILVGLLVVYQRIVIYTRGVRTTGRVVAGTTRVEPHADGPPRRTHALLIEVVDESTGKRFTFKSSFGSSATRIEVGQTVPVRYVPGEESAAEIDELLPMWFFPIGCIAFGSLLIWALGRI